MAQSPINRNAGIRSFQAEKIILAGLACLVACTIAVWLAGWITAHLVGATSPTLAPSALFVLANGGYKGVPIVVHVIILALLIAPVIWLFIRAVHFWERRKHTTKERSMDFEHKPGWASAHEVEAEVSVKALMRMSSELRPSLTHPTPNDVGYYLGESRGCPVWASVERSFLIVGPPGSGKGLYFAVNMILDAKGAVATTSTKPDNIKLTLRQRQEVGPCGIFDPPGMVGNSFAGLVSWDIVEGCENPQRSAARAAALVAQAAMSKENASWEGHARVVIEACLHAAAVQRQATGSLEGTTIRDIYRWWQDANGNGLKTPAAILRAYADHPGCRNPDYPDEPVTCQWASALESKYDGDVKFVSNVMSVVHGAAAPLSFPQVLASLTPSPNRPAISAERLLEENGTIYCLATDKGQAAAAGFVSALIEDIAFAARARAARMPNGRLDPPPLFLLDECANTASIPSLPTLLADGRGQNITIVPIFQTLAQVRSRYGKEDAGTIFSASTVKVILGGSDDPDDTKDISHLIGEYDEIYTTSSQNAHTAIIDMHASTSMSMRKVPIVAPNEIRSVPRGLGICMQSQMNAFPVRLRDWRDREDADEIRACQKIVDAEILAAGGIGIAAQ